MRSGGNAPRPDPERDPDERQHRPRDEEPPREAACPRHARGRQWQQRPWGVLPGLLAEPRQVRVLQERAQPGAAKERVLRGVDLQLRRADQHREQPRAHDRAAARDRHRHASGVGGPAAFGLAEEGPERRDREDEDAHEEELRVGEARAAQERGRRVGPALRARGERGARDEERHREREVRHVAAAQVHREQPGRQPGEEPGQTPARRPSTHERDRGEADARRQGVLHPGDRRHERQVQRARGRRDRGRDPGALADHRQPLGGTHPRPPHVHGDVGPHAEPPRPLHRRPQEDDEEHARETREPREVAPCACRRSAVSVATPSPRRCPGRSRSPRRPCSTGSCTGTSRRSAWAGPG